MTDTDMMGVVHSALRRDLERTRIVLASGPVPQPRRTALAEHLTWLMQFLHHHHLGEDEGLFPLALAKDPTLGPLIDAMDVEHEAIEPAMAQLETAARAWSGDAVAQERVLTALDRLEDVLLPHLAHEERELMPRVAAVLTREEWLEWDRRTNIEPRTRAELAFVGHWFLDNAGAEVRRTVEQVVPPLPRFVLVRLMGGAYRRRRAELWAGTPAARLGPLTAGAHEALAR